MIPTWLFPSTLIGVSFISAVVYAIDGDWRRAAYWTAATVITITVTF